jgi:hypothetical protein
MDASAPVLSPEGNARCFKRPASTLRDYGLRHAVLCLRRESLTQTGSIGFSGGLNEPSILGTQFTMCSITRRLPCVRATASQQARIFCPENLCSEMPQCFAFVGSRSSRKAHDRFTAGGRPECRAALPVRHLGAELDSREEVNRLRLLSSSPMTWAFAKGLTARHPQGSPSSASDGRRFFVASSPLFRRRKARVDDSLAHVDSTS